VAGTERAGRGALSHHLGPTSETWESSLARLIEPKARPHAAIGSQALHMVVVLDLHVRGAALLMSAAFHEAGVEDFYFAAPTPPRKERGGADRDWFSILIHQTLGSSRQVRNALAHR
jgi:hypothetical protein